MTKKKKQREMERPTTASDKNVKKKNQALKRLKVKQHPIKWKSKREEARKSTQHETTK